MGIMDFLFGKPEQTGQLDPRIEAARNFLLEQAMQQSSSGPVDVPQYQAVAPAAMYSGTNDLLSSLGLGTVAPPSMPTVNVGGVEAYSSQPFQEQIETAYGERYPGQYEFLRSFYRDRVTGEPGTRAYGYVDPNAAVTMPGGGGGGGGNQYNNSDSDSTAYATEMHNRLFPSDRSTTSINTPLSRAPGGIDTVNPGSTFNQIAALATGSNRPIKQPTKSSRPVSRTPYVSKGGGSGR
jgi:hypothetical protein